MTLYFTRFNLKRLSKSFMNLRFLRFIDIQKIINEFSGTVTSDVKFILNKKIEDQLISALKSKRYNGVIYSHPNLNADIIKNVIQLTEKYTSDIIFIDELEDNPDICRDQFKKIIYFPSGSRERIIKCEPVINEMFEWLNKN